MSKRCGQPSEPSDLPQGSCYEDRHLRKLSDQRYAVPHEPASSEERANEYESGDQLRPLGGERHRRFAARRTSDHRNAARLDGWNQGGQTADLRGGPEVGPAGLDRKAMAERIDPVHPVTFAQRERYVLPRKAIAGDARQHDHGRAAANCSAIHQTFGCIDEFAIAQMLWHKGAVTSERPRYDQTRANTCAGRP